MAEKEYTIEGVIVKKGRKYFQVHLDTFRNPDYTQKLIIDDMTKELKAGDRFSLTAEITWAYGYRDGKPYVDFYTAVNPETKRLSEIQRWFGYCKNAYEEGYIYYKGWDKLIELDAKEERIQMKKWEAEIAEKKAAEKAAREAEWKAEKAAREAARRAEEAKYTRLSFGVSEGRLISTGDIIVRNNKAYKVISKHYESQDGWSFGVMDEAWYSVKALDVTDTAEGAAKIEARKQEIAEKAAAEKAAAEKAAARESIDKTVRTTGKRIPACTLHDLEEGKTVVWNTINAYGGGSELLTDSRTVWLIQNNGADGDNWSHNDIWTGGAGAYGFTAEMTAELAEAIEVLGVKVQRKENMEKNWKFEVESEGKLFWYLYPATGKEVEDAVSGTVTDLEYKLDDTAFFNDYGWDFGWMGVAYCFCKEALEDCIEKAKEEGVEIDPDDVEIVDLPEMERGWNDMWKGLAEKDDAIRDRLNAEMAPCAPLKFLEAFIEGYNSAHADDLRYYWSEYSNHEIFTMIDEDESILGEKDAGGETLSQYCCRKEA